MSKLSQLAGKSKIYKIGEIELEFHPLTMKNIELFVDIENDAKRGKALKDVMHIALKKAVPDATQEEIDNVATEHFEAIMTSIMDVNGFKGDKEEFMAKMRHAQQTGGN